MRISFFIWEESQNFALFARLLVLSIFLLGQISWARPGDEKPPEVQLPLSIIRNILRTHKSTLPSGYDKNFRVFKENGYERVFSFENKMCSFDGWLSFNIQRSFGSESVTEIVSWTCNKIRDYVVFKRWGKDLKVTPAENLVAFNFFEQDFPADFEIELNSLNVQIQHKKQRGGQFSLFLNTKNSEGFFERLEILKIKDSESLNTKWVYRLMKKKELSIENESEEKKQEPFELSQQVRVFETESFYHGDGLYSYQHLINGAIVDRPVFLEMFNEEIKPFFAIVAPEEKKSEILLFSQ